MLEDSRYEDEKEKGRRLRVPAQVRPLLRKGNENQSGGGGSTKLGHLANSHVTYKRKTHTSRVVLLLYLR